MEPISATLTGLALAQKGISFLKENIDTLNDARSVAKSVTAILDGHQDFNRKRYKTSTKAVAEEMIEYKLQQEEMYEIKRLVNHRFGIGFWESIIQERAKRLQEEEAENKRIAAERRKQWQLYKQVAIGCFVALALAGGLLIVFTTVAI